MVVERLTKNRKLPLKIKRLTYQTFFKRKDKTYAGGCYDEILRLRLRMTNMVAVLAVEAIPRVERNIKRGNATSE